MQYLDLTLDAKLTWNIHMEKVTNKGKMVMVMKRTVGNIWELNPRTMLWMYMAVKHPN